MNVMRRILLSFAIVAAMMPPRVDAHVTSTSYLTLELGGGQVQGEWEIAVRDIEYLLRLDRARFPPEAAVPLEALAGYALPRLTLRADGQDVPAQILDASVGLRAGVPHALFTLAAPWPEAARLEIDYRLFVVDEDPNHRALFSVTSGDVTHTGVLAKDSPVRRLTLREPSLRATFADFLRQGVWHIWLGFDHVAFLLALLLPSVLVRTASGWEVAGSGRRVLAEVMRVVTAFTVAHSVTLVLATLGLVRLSGSIVEPAIAVSVLWAAAANLRPTSRVHGWPAAFAFGLLHGFGFAGALQELELPARHLGWALLAFNVGVELGQLAIVTVFVPVAFAWRGRGWYQTRVLRYGSLMIAVLAVIWLGQRLSGS